MRHAELPRSPMRHCFYSALLLWQRRFEPRDERVHELDTAPLLSHVGVGGYLLLQPRHARVKHPLVVLRPGHFIVNAAIFKST